MHSNTFRSQMEAELLKHPLNKTSKAFGPGYLDGWYGHSIRSSYMRFPSYKEGLEAGKKDGKEQRLINLLEKHT
jgi:hypothetical protein